MDVVPSLVEAAQAQGGGEFHLLSYADVAAGALERRADVVVCNFSLLGEASVDELLAAVPSLLEPGGVLLVQTLHPLAVRGRGALSRWLARWFLGRLRRRFRQAGTLVLPHARRLVGCVQERRPGTHSHR